MLTYCIFRRFIRRVNEMITYRIFRILTRCHTKNPIYVSADTCVYSWFIITATGAGTDNTHENLSSRRRILPKDGTTTVEL